MTSRTFQSVLFIALTATVVGLDALTKALAHQTLGASSARDSVWLIEQRVGFQYGENSGIAFGMFQGQGRIVLVASAAAIVALIVLLPRIAGGSAWNVLAAALLTGGAFGNVIDRIRFGHVRDFIVLDPIPPFNVADAALTLGIVLLGFALFRPEDSATERIGYRGSAG